MENLKNKININCLVILFAAVTGLFGCKKDVNTGPASRSNISFAVKADQSASSLATANLGSSATGVTTINWTEGIANVAKFEFEAKRNGFKQEIEVKGLTNVNLFALDPSFVNAAIDSGVYNEIELKLVFHKSTSAAIPLTLKGSYVKADGTAVPVELYVNEDLEIKSEVRNVVIDQNTDLKTTIMLHLNNLFQNINAADLEAAVLTSGKIVISSSSNSNIFIRAKSNVQHIGETEVEGEHEHHGGHDD